MPHSFEEPHPATVYFADALRRVMAGLKMRKVGTNELQPVTPYALQRMLQEQSPNTPVSLTQMYRIINGETPPKIDVVWELASILGVSPREFMPEEGAHGAANKSPITLPSEDDADEAPEPEAAQDSSSLQDSDASS